MHVVKHQLAGAPKLIVIGPIENDTELRLYGADNPFFAPGAEKINRKNLNRDNSRVREKLEQIRTINEYHGGP